MDLCICIQLGCSTKYSQEGGEVYLCPRCHNGSITAVKETRCLQICCVDLVPLGSKHVYMCSICQYQASQDGPAPQKVQGGSMPYQQQQQGYAPQQGMNREFPHFRADFRESLN